MYNDEVERRRAIAKRKRIKRAEIVLFAMIAVAVVVGAIVVVMKNLRDVNTVVYEDRKMYQYFAGVRYEYDGTVTIEQQSGNITSLSYGDAKVNIDHTPVYFNDDNTLALLPKSMELVILRNGNQLYKVQDFTEVSFSLENDNLMVFLGSGENRRMLEKSFLYDGEDLYVFPYGATMKVGDVEYELSPLSYTRVGYGADVEIYDKEKEVDIIMEDNSKDVIAEISGYKINLSTDMVLYDSGSKLLVKNYTNFPVYNE